MTDNVEDIPCEHVITRVWDFLDDEIDADRKEQIRRHLETCDHCRDQYTFEGSFLRAVARILDQDTHAESLRRRVEAALVTHGFSRPS
jgi:anti-sigma factor (TIGR02949 family)